MKRFLGGFASSFFFVMSLQSGDWRVSPYFDTKFLTRYDEVSRALVQKEGAQEGFFMTEDAVSINYLWIKRPHARYTMVCCSGFWPGRKEGLATFYAMMPDDCNLLFFDARGHGKSGGKFLSRIWGYGSQEYKDVIGALHFAAKQQPCPLILYGVCAGAFHAVHAVLHLQERGMMHRALHIKGLIFDSGWSSMAEASHTAFASEVDGVLRKTFKEFPWLYRSTNAVASGVLSAAHFCIARPVLYWRRHELSLEDKVNMLDLPVLYIHAESDQYARIEPVKALAEHTPHATYWWIKEQSKHACHHLKLKEQYRDTLLGFIDGVF